MFSFINEDVGNYIKTVKRINATNFRIETKGMFTGTMLKNNSTLSIKNSCLIIENTKNFAYQITINSLTSLGKNNIYQNVWINDNTKYMLNENNNLIKSKIKCDEKKLSKISNCYISFIIKNNIWVNFY